MGRAAWVVIAVVALIACERALEHQDSFVPDTSACAPDAEVWHLAPHASLEWTSVADSPLSLESEPPLFFGDSRLVEEVTRDSSGRRTRISSEDGRSLVPGRVYNVRIAGPDRSFAPTHGRRIHADASGQLCLVASHVRVDAPAGELPVDPVFPVRGFVAGTAPGTRASIAIHLDSADGFVAARDFGSLAGSDGVSRFDVQLDARERRGHLTLFVVGENGEYDFASISVSAPQTMAKKVCKGPLKTRITSGPSGITNDTSPTFAFTNSPGTNVGFACSLDSAGFADCTSPFSTPLLVDGPHHFEVFASCDGSRGATASRSFIVDTGGPDTLITSGPADGSTVSSSPVVFVFASSEAGSTLGCAFDSSAFTPCTSPYTTTTLSLGSHSFRVRATDAAGNIDATPASRTFTFSPTPPPDTTIVSGPPPLTNQRSANFTFTSTASPATFSCSLEGAIASACTSPFTTTALSDGAHTFRVTSTDSLGQVDATPAVASFTVDATPPDTTITAGPAALTASPTVSFAFTSTEAPSTFQCSFDGGAFSTCVSPFITAALADGPHSFAVVAVDAAGNVDPTPALRPLTVDATPPDTTITASPSGTTTDHLPSFAFVSSESGSTFECSLDSSPFAACASPVSATVADGSHNFAVRAIDVAGNVDSTPATASFTVVTGTPETTITSAPAALTNNAVATFTFVSDDSRATFECSLDGDPFLACDSPHASAALPDGLHVFLVRAVSLLGSADPTPASASFQIDTVAPVTLVDEDRKAIAYAGLALDLQLPEIFIEDDRGLDRLQITGDNVINEGAFAPRWSPDGSKLVFDDGTSPHRLHLIDRDGANQRIVLNAQAHPAWSPNGKRLAILGNPFTFDSFVITIFGLDGSGEVDIATGSTQVKSGIDWSRDGSKFVFGGFSPDEPNSLFWINADGTGLTRIPNAHGSFSGTEPRFSPDGTRISFNTDDCEFFPDFGNICWQEVATVGLDGSGLQILTPGRETNGASASWSQDGRRLVFSSTRSAPWRFTMNSDGSDVRPVGTNSEGLSGPDWMRRPVTVWPFSNDASPTFLFTASEAATFECWIDGAAPVRCVSPWQSLPLTDGAHAFYVRATDLAGNADPAPAVFLFSLDAAPPETAITAGPTGPSRVATPTFTFVSSEAPPIFECSVDTARFSTCASPYTLAALADGSHTFAARAIDTAGNIDATPATAAFTVDSSAPTLTLVSPPDLSSSNSSTVAVTIASSETATITTSNVFVMGTSLPAGNASTSLILAPGYNTFTIAASDAAGNVGRVAFTLFYNAPGIAPPDTTIVSGPSGPTNLTTLTFAFVSNDAHAHFECSLDGVAFGACTSPRTVGPLAQGSHSFAARAIDVAGNVDATPAVASFSVDTTPPVLALVSPANGSTTGASPALVTISASEPVVVTDSDVFPSGASLSGGNTTVSLSLRNGYNTFAIFARDLAGNSTLLTFSLSLDDTPPSLAFLSPASGASVSFSPANVLVSLSENVTIVSQNPGGWLAPGTTLSGGEKTLVLPVAASDNVFEATLRDSAGNQIVYSAANGNAFHLARVTGAPSAPAIASPFPGANFETRTIAVTGSAARTLDPATHAVQVRVQAASTAIVPVDAAGNWMAIVNLSVGANRIRATALNIAGSASPETSIVVSANATERVASSSGDLQAVAVGQLAPAPLVAQVTDLAGNALAGIPVTFSIATEPASADGYIGSVGRKSVSITSDATGLASVLLTVATSETNAAGFLQATVVAATVPSQYGPAATFKTQGLGAYRFVANNPNPPAQLIPLDNDCTPTAASPLGECPLGEAGSTVPGFAALLLDRYGSVVAGPGLGCAGTSGAGCVTFTVVGAGDLNNDVFIQVAADAQGIARSGPFGLGKYIFDPAVGFVMLHPEDRAATKIGLRKVTAHADGVNGVVTFAAGAYPGKPDHLLNQTQSSGLLPTVQTSTPDPFVVLVADYFGNRVANAQVTFAADTRALDYDPTDPPKFFRTDPTATDAPPCDFKLAHQEDACAVDSVTATSFSEGEAFAQVIVGKHAGLDYNAIATAGAAIATMSRITAPIYDLATPTDAEYALQVQATAAATFAIDDTENDDTDPITAVVWKVQCDDVAPADGVCNASGTFHSERHAGDPVSFSADQGAFFSPASAVTGAQTSIDGGGRAPVTAPEVAALLHGPPEGDVLMVLGVIARLPQGILAINAPGAAAKPTLSITKPILSLSCMHSPAMNPHSLCDPLQFDEAPECRRDSAGVQTYIDIKNGYTENEALVVTVVHPPPSPVANRPVRKYAHGFVVDGGDPTIKVNYFDPNASDLVGAEGTPGLYALPSSVLPPGPKPGTFFFEYSPSFNGCREMLAKSYVRGAPGVFTATDLPAPILHFGYVDKSGTLVQFLKLNVRDKPGWVDLIRRQHNADVRAGADSAPDWFEVQAADLWENPPILPSEGVAETTDGEDFPLAGGAGWVDPAEPRDIYAQVEGIDIIRIVLPGGPSMNFTAAVDVNGNGFPVRGVNDSGWQMSRRILLNLADPTLRTNGLVPETFEAGIRWSTPHEFRGAFAHESRHVWQNELLTLTGNAFCNDEASKCTNASPNRNPNNNDDFEFYDSTGKIQTQTIGIVTKPIVDCIPERALLLLPENSFRDIGGKGDLGVRGSAFGLLDTSSNFERSLNPSLTIGGEDPADPSSADQCEFPTQSGTILRERDAIRFQRAVQETHQ